VDRYWDLRFAEVDSYDEEQVAEELLTRLRDAVRCRLVSDVPVGALLSGGIDSGIVVALMAELSASPVKTYTIGFSEPSFSELPLARQVAQKYGTDHHEFTVTPEVISVLPTLVHHHDAPFYDPSAIPMYYVSKLAGDHVKVVLSGDGGDELFAGYNLYLAEKATRYYRHAPRWVRETVMPKLARLVPESTSYINKGRVLREFAYGASLDFRQRYARWTTKSKEETRRRLYAAPELLELLTATRDGHLSVLFDRQATASALNQMLYVDINTELTNQVLLKVDRMSMACSLEVRSPLLDHQLHEFAARLPDQAKLKGWKTKYLLKKVGARLLPPDLLKRPKRGFSPPLDRWFREDLADFAREVLLDSAARRRGYFKQNVVEELIEEHVSGRASYSREIWTLLTIELWHQMYIDRFEYAKA
jgi:asparagine synthase (glutamine-hydrolysing)